MNWDDLRIILAVRDGGTYAAAASSLRIDETTVARRIARAQKTLGVTLFEAVDGRRRPTSAGAAIVNRIETVARQIGEIRRIGQTQEGLGGNFRIAATASLAEEILAPQTGDFLRQHPGIRLQVVTASENVNFSRWEADFALRLRQPQRGDFTISKLGEYRLWSFKPSHRADGNPPIVCAYPDDLAFTPESRHLDAAGLQGTARLVTDRVRIIRALVASGNAMGILPEYLCADLRSNPALIATRLREMRPIWLLAQNHLKRDQAAQAVVAWLRGCFAAFR
ncbi:LysR family transcriptional regulator [Reyranella sp. CPCC 100927]|uniref:LysR family transcriptional regulator n=1 Tax=Reyranella sp. CPCC 100927 TaxID=2599616 RepID=UPI0011B4E098|nr:LysR family transcriptional regulator [Reyranella sp. CPCC 100927]TWT09472.1 LysR family transcriptional regulator [Reyranella sp. CPCC 100927]